ncbi:hypothetical protein KIPB_001236 [Kipferlia bialata]|uniref:Uncharacterized protein n=1 Tax=Kipferlia bialata TaxID=797122 RepID=A0A9K3CQ07_9EUKA|nr:hypothetical protein KIPB_001236 [Kipferlia bialata]|eukprot:g1236.t1
MAQFYNLVELMIKDVMSYDEHLESDTLRLKELIVHLQYRLGRNKNYRWYPVEKVSPTLFAHATADLEAGKDVMVGLIGEGLAQRLGSTANGYRSFLECKDCVEQRFSVLISKAPPNLQGFLITDLARIMSEAKTDAESLRILDSPPSEWMGYLTGLADVGDKLASVQGALSVAQERLRAPASKRIACMVYVREDMEEEITGRLRRTVARWEREIADRRKQLVRERAELKKNEDT